MSRRDRVDEELARRLAWRVVRPGEAFDFTTDAPEPEPEAQPQAEGDADETADAWEEARDAARHACQLLAAGIDRAWDLADNAAQARATANLTRKAGSLGAALVVMSEHPSQSVRLARLAARHLRRLPRSAREAAAAACLWLDFAHPATPDLLIEVAEAGAERLVWPIAMALRKEGATTTPWRDAAARVARVLDEGPSWTARLIALEWLEVMASPATVPSLRRALRVPHLQVRQRALALLLRMPPPALSADDVLFLLDDLLVHPPVEGADAGHGGTLHDYAGSLREAVVAVRPTDGHDALLEIASGRHPDFQFPSFLDDRWALASLAAGYPEHAEPLIDEGLRHGPSWGRRAAVEAAALLPPASADRRLLAAAADPTPLVAERARDLWLELHASPCPVDELAGVSGAPSPAGDRLRSRLAVLRGSSDGAREAMLEALLGVPTDGDERDEAVALLAFALGDRRLVSASRPGLPGNAYDWVHRLYTRFGASALGAIVDLEERSREPYPGWLTALDRLLSAGVVRPDDLPALEAIVVARLDAAPPDQPDQIDGLLALLAHTGSPADRLELLWQLATEPGDEEVGVQLNAAAALVACRAGPALDGRLVDEMERAVAAGDLHRFGRLARVAIPRRVPAAVALARRNVDGVEDPRAIEVLVSCARELKESRQLARGWLTSALAQPERLRFLVATRLVRACPQRLTARQRALLDGALASPARGGLAAVGAAVALLAGRRPIAPDHPTVRALLRRTPLIERSELVDVLCFREASLAVVGRSLTEMLCSTAPEVTHWALALVPFLCTHPRYRQFLRRVLPRVADPSVRVEIEDVLGLPIRGARYWQR